MGRFIHRKDTPDGPLYREWSTVSDCYATNPMTREEATIYLTRIARADLEKRMAAVPKDVEARLSRADRKGTSEHGEKRRTTRWADMFCDYCSEWHGEQECMRDA